MHTFYILREMETEAEVEREIREPREKCVHRIDRSRKEGEDT